MAREVARATQKSEIAKRLEISPFCAASYPVRGTWIEIEYDGNNPASGEKNHRPGCYTVEDEGRERPCIEEQRRR